MKAASISEIKEALKEKTPAQLAELCLRLARFKKENKELLTYLLFEADDPETYIGSVQHELDEGFAAVNRSNLYFAKKSLRKLLRTANKYIKYTGSKTVEVELLLYYCGKLKESKLPLHKSPALDNLYQGQVKKVYAAIEGLHEDLQHDYLRRLEAL